MLLVRSLKSALKSLLLHKLRSGLTMLGIVFGVFSVIAMLAIGEGASAQAQQQVLELGATNIIVRSIKPPEDASSGGERSRVLRYGLTETDYEILRRTLPTVTLTVPVRELPVEVRRLEYVFNARVVGATPDYSEMNSLSVLRGRFLQETDLDRMSNVAVIGSETAEILFPYEDPLGKPVQIASRAYRVVGVMAPRTASAAIGGSLSGQDYNKDIYIPLSTLQSRINTRDLYIQAQTGSFSAESVRYNQITLQVADREFVLPTAEVVREVLDRNHGSKRDTAVVVPLELLKQADQLRLIFNVVLGSIAAISLLVGGIGIMNIMLATVTERTREIGIRRALGARRRDITNQFLMETVVLSGIGGLVGIGLGLITPLVFEGIQQLVKTYVLEGGTSDAGEVGRIFTEMRPQIAPWSLPTAFGISVGIGVLFGVYPARSAARLDPIEALRHE